jgi:hypothetical protein
LRTPTHLYSATSQIAWTAVVQPALSEDWDFPVCAPLLPEEIRILGAVLLSEPDPWTHGFPQLDRGYAATLPLAPEDDGSLDALSHQCLVDHATELLHSGDGHSPQTLKRFEVYDGCSHTDAVVLLQNIDSSDQLILAGLARLLGASRLISFAEEPEEGAVSLFVSMGAALEFLRLHIAGSSGTENVPFSAVSDYLRATFPDGAGLAEYYEERHDERVITIHPASRFGEFWAPPLMVADVYHLQKSLFGLYRHILLGEIEAADSDKDAR